MQYIDTHSHIHDKAFDADIFTTVKTMEWENISTITVGTDLDESKKAQKVANKYSNVWFTAGVHPCDDVNAVFDEEKFEELVVDPKCVAIGECGLDYYWIEKNFKYGKIENIDDEKERQKVLFMEQIQFAVKHNKPLMLHGRPSPKSEENINGMDAYIDMLSILRQAKKEAVDVVRGNVHFFVGDITIAKEFLELGFTFSLGGVLTLTDEYDEVVKFLPIESIHAETDSPYVTPKKDGKKVAQRNSPLYIPLIVERIAQLKERDRGFVAQQLIKNAERLYGLK